MFSVIRIVIGCVFLGCSILVIKRSKSIHKRLLYVVFAIISVVMTSVSALLPIENLFITFKSPQAVYDYYTFGKSDLDLVVEGDSCDFLIDRKKDADTYLIIPKTTDGWKIGVGRDTRKILQKITDGITIYVFQYKKTNDYFITILDTNGEESTVSDEYHSAFYALEKHNDSSGKTFVTYYAHLTNLNPQYTVTVNGNEIVLDSQ